MITEQVTRMAANKLHIVCRIAQPSHDHFKNLSVKGPITIETRTVYTDEMIRCEECGNPYASAKMIKKVSTMLHDETTKLCPSCRQRKIYEKIFDGSYRLANPK